MILRQLKTGEIAKVIAIEGGRSFRQNLSLRGVTEGSIIRVVSNMGPVTVEVDRNIVALGRGMTQKIRVLKV
jgi:ferrous iron transport protein A